MVASSPPVRAGVAPARLHQPADEIVGRGFGGPAGVGESDQVRQRVVAKPARHLCAARGTRYGRYRVPADRCVPGRRERIPTPSVRARIISSVAIH